MAQKMPAVWIGVPVQQSVRGVPLQLGGCGHQCRVKWRPGIIIHAIEMNRGERGAQSIDECRAWCLAHQHTKAHMCMLQSRTKRLDRQ